MKISLKVAVRLSLFSLFLSLAVFVQAQQSFGTISGTVSCNDGNFPARGAKVELIPISSLISGSSEPSTGDLATTTTDLAGFYEIWKLSPGTYIVHATYGGYSDDLKLAEGLLEHATPDEQKRLLAAFPQVTIKPGVTVQKDFVLHRAGAISGRVTFDLGGTARRSVVLVAMVSANLPTTSTSASKANFFTYEQSSTVDDRGYYRIAGLPPGKYRISVRYSDSFLEGKDYGNGNHGLEAQRAGLTELTVYAPEALEESDAKLIDLQNDDEITDADITVPTRLLHSIGGTVTHNGAPAGNVALSLRRQGGPVQAHLHEAITMPDGSYRFDLLPPGNYTIRAKPTSWASPALKALFGQRSLQLTDADLLDANIDLNAKATEK